MTLLLSYVAANSGEASLWSSLDELFSAVSMETLARWSPWPPSCPPNGSHSQKLPRRTLYLIKWEKHQISIVNLSNMPSQIFSRLITSSLVYKVSKSWWKMQVTISKSPMWHFQTFSFVQPAVPKTNTLYWWERKAANPHIEEAVTSKSLTFLNQLSK